MTFPDRFIISQFRRATDAKPREKTLTWDGLKDLLTNHVTRPGERGTDVGKDGPLWSPASYPAEKHRNAKNVGEVCAFVLDADHCGAPEEFAGKWITPTGEPLAHIIYSSWKNTDDDPRWRLVVPFVHPIPAAEFPDVFRKMSYHLLGAAQTDEACKDTCRMYYQPSCAPEARGEAFAFFREGRALDPVDFPDLPAKSKPSTAPRPRPREGTNRYPTQKMLDQALSNAGTKGRNNCCLALAVQLRDNGYSEGEAESVALDYAGLVPHTGDTFTDDEALKCVSNAYTRPPRDPSAQPGDGIAERARTGAAPYIPPTKTTRKRQPTPKGSEESSEPKEYPLTDLGNAERLMRRYGHELRYNGAWGWLIWDGKRWQADQSGEIFRRIEATVRLISLEAAALNRRAANTKDEDERIALNKKAAAVTAWAIKSEGAARIKACADLAEHQPGVYADPAAFDANPWILNVQNGILDLRTFELLTHDPNTLCSKICPVGYYPDAKAPMFERCMQTWQPDPEVRAFLYRAMGYSLTGHTGEEAAFLLYGLGRNGKSKFTGALEHIMGDYAGRAPIEIFMQGNRNDGTGPTPDKADLAGKRLIIASEIVQARRFNEAFVKDVTGGDKIKAAHKFRDPFEFKPLLKLWLYGNHKPIVGGADDGIKARLPLIPFTVTIPKEERDHDLDAKLRAEGEGILALAVHGCAEWRVKRLSPPAAIVEASEAYHEEMDTLAGFFKAKCIFGDGKQIWTPTAELRSALSEWARGEGVDERTIPKPAEFAERLRRLGCDDNGGVPLRRGKQTVRCWSNVRLRTDDDAIDVVETHTQGASVTPVTHRYAKNGNFSYTDIHVESSANAVTSVTGVTNHRKEPGNFLDDLTDPFSDEEELEDEGEVL